MNSALIFPRIDEVSYKLEEFLRIYAEISRSNEILPAPHLIVPVEHFSDLAGPISDPAVRVGQFYS